MICVYKLYDENPETSQIQAKGSSGEGQNPRVEKDEGPEAEILSSFSLVPLFIKIETFESKYEIFESFEFSDVSINTNSSKSSRFQKNLFNVCPILLYVLRNEQ